MDSIEEIKSKIDVVSLLSEYIPLTRAGRNFKTLCPFHKEKTPSFVVSPELGIWHCFGACGEGGDIFKFLMKIEGMEFGEAARFLAERAGVKLTTTTQGPGSKEQLYELNALALKFYQYFLTGHLIGSRALAYLKSDRGLRLSTIKQFSLGFAPPREDALVRFLINKKSYKDQELLRVGLAIGGQGKLIDRLRNRIVFPLVDHRGNVLGFSGRLLPTDESKNLAKYVNTPETPIYHKRMHLFGIDMTHGEIRQKGTAILVEGEFDLLSLWQRDITNVVAVKGSTFTTEQAHLVGRFAREVVFAFDQDAAGEKALQTGVLTAEQEGLRSKIVLLGASKDPDQAVRVDHEGFLKKIASAQDAYDYFIDQAFMRYNPRTADGVRSISQTLTPILAQVKDSILKAHYTRLIAQRLGIAEGAVVGQLLREAEKLRDKRLSQTLEPGHKRSRREVLEEHLIALSLLWQPEFLLLAEVGVLVTVPLLVRIRDGLVSYLKDHKKKKFVAANFVRSLPKELIEGTSALLLDPSAGFDYEQQQAVRELERIRHDINVLTIQEHIAHLTAVIRDKEMRGTKSNTEQEELASLVSKLSVLSVKAFSTN